jgi:hypothetical protein
VAEGGGGGGDGVRLIFPGYVCVWKLNKSREGEVKAHNFLISSFIVLIIQALW